MAEPTDDVRPAGLRLALDDGEVLELPPAPAAETGGSMVEPNGTTAARAASDRIGELVSRTAASATTSSVATPSAATMQAV